MVLPHHWVITAAIIPNALRLKVLTISLYRSLSETFNTPQSSQNCVWKKKFSSNFLAHCLPAYFDGYACPIRWFKIYTCKDGEPLCISDVISPKMLETSVSIHKVEELNQWLKTFLWPINKIKIQVFIEIIYGKTFSIIWNYSQISIKLNRYQNPEPSPQVKTEKLWNCERERNFLKKVTFESVAVVSKCNEFCYFWNKSQRNAVLLATVLVRSLPVIGLMEMAATLPGRNRGS